MGRQLEHGKGGGGSMHGDKWWCGVVVVKQEEGTRGKKDGEREL